MQLQSPYNSRPAPIHYALTKALEIGSSFPSASERSMTGIRRPGADGALLLPTLQVQPGKWSPLLGPTPRRRKTRLCCGRRVICHICYHTSLRRVLGMHFGTRARCAMILSTSARDVGRGGASWRDSDGPTDAWRTPTQGPLAACLALGLPLGCASGDPGRCGCGCQVGGHGRLAARLGRGITSDLLRTSALSSVQSPFTSPSFAL